jgi:energy-coupling factor transporter ATP-binding protein EcfA2
MIDVTGVSYTYPNSSQAALNDVTMRVDAGEFVLLAGASGSGKTTLLRCLNGLIPHFSGGVISGNVKVNDLDTVRSGPQTVSKHVGFVAQNPEGHALLDRVEPEIAFALENAAVSPQEMRVRVEEVLDLLDLTPLRQRLISSLSGGERQRVAIASVLALRPQVLLLDEPTSQLDPQSADDVLRSLVRLNEDLGLTIILVEHRLERVLRYADRLVFMDNGRILIDEPVRSAMAKVPQLPPLARLGRELGWDPLPLTVKEGRHLVSKGSGVSRQPSTVAVAGTSHAPRAQVLSEPVTILKAAQIHYSYNGSPALRGVSFEVRQGEVLAVMGRNGSGKSTLLKCLIGLLQVSQGDIRLNGRSTSGREVAELAREIAYLPQNPNDLLFAETVREELQITLRNHGLAAQNGVTKLLDELGLKDQMFAYPRDLSTGQRQRVALGAVTITRPPLLLLDEPTRGLDFRTKQALVKLWRDWLAHGLGLVLVTHDVELAAVIADRVIILSQGEVIASGSTGDVLSGSPLFAPQIARLFPGRGWLTVEDAIDGLIGVEKK